MTDTIDPKLVDKRIIARLIRKGAISDKDYEKHLKSLPDLAESAQPIEATLEPMQVSAGGSHPEEE